MISKQLRMAALAAIFIGGSATIASAQSGSSIGAAGAGNFSAAPQPDNIMTGAQARAQYRGSLSRPASKTKHHKGHVSSRTKMMAH
jgi:hypothetical protein